MKNRKGFLQRRGKTWHAVWYIAGRRYAKTTGQTDKRDAEKELGRIIEPYLVKDEIKTLQNVKSRIEGAKAELTILDEQRNPPLLLESAWDAYDRAGNRREISPVTMRNYECHWKNFLRWLGETHPEAKTLREITFEICEDYKEHMAELKVTGRTFNAHRAFLRSFFNVLTHKARLTENPWAKIAKRDEHSIGRRPLTVEELRNVCQNAKGELRIMLAFGLYLGCRLGDAACMDWGNVDMERRLIRYIPRKTARKKPEPLLIPIHPELYIVLSETAPGNRKGPVTPDMAERYQKHQGIVSNLIQEHFEACGLTTTSERNGVGIRRSVVAGFHSLRHSAVSFLRQAGAAQSVSQAIVGHNSPDVHALYTHTDEDALRRAVATLPAVIGDSPALLPAKTRDEQLREIIEGMTPKTLKKDKARLLKLLETV